MAHVERGELGLGYWQMPDEEVVLHARRGSKLAIEHLLGKYRSLVEGKAKGYYLAGAEHDDVVQEGMIGLFKAIRDYSSDRLSAFRSFAELCITRQIITAVKTAMRQKHWVLNTYVSMDTPLAAEEGPRKVEDILVDCRPTNPEQLLLRWEFGDEVFDHIRRDLSELEAQALSLHLDGKSYGEIGTQVGCNVKQVDNALQRAKKKMMRRLKSGEALLSSAGADVAQG